MPFTGFPEDSIRFLAELRRDNTKSWFDANRRRYDEAILEPSRAWVVDMGQRLAPLFPGIHAEPQVNRSLFRLNRDTRFSADKTPYKTEVGLFLWVGNRERTECPGFYLHFEPGSPDTPLSGSLMVGVGIWMFSPKLLPRYRQAVVHPEKGRTLRDAVEAVRAFAGPKALEARGCGGTIDHYQRVPQGFDPNHPNADLLKLKGLHAGVGGPLPSVFHGPGLLDFAFEQYRGMAPLVAWMDQALG